MVLKEKILQNLREAQKSRNTIIVATLRMLNAALNNKQIEKRTKLSKNKDKDIQNLQEESELNEEEVTRVISSEIKKRKEAIESFEKGNRADLVEKERKELEVLQKYAPKQLSQEQLREVVQRVIKELGVTEAKNMGLVMKQVMSELGVQAEGSRVVSVVKEFLK